MLKSSGVAAFGRISTPALLPPVELFRRLPKLSLDLVRIRTGVSAIRRRDLAPMAQRARACDQT